MLGIMDCFSMTEYQNQDLTPMGYGCVFQIMPTFRSPQRPRLRRTEPSLVRNVEAYVVSAANLNWNLAKTMTQIPKQNFDRMSAASRSDPVRQGES